MKTIAAASALVALVALGSLSMGCSASPTNGSGGRGKAVSTSSALSALKSPTGSFSKATASSAFAGYRSQRESSKHVSAPVPNGGGSAGGASIRTVRLLDKATSSGACTASQDCACPTGGTMSYQSEQSPDGQLVNVHFTACGFEDGLKFDGDAVLLASTKSILGAAAATPSKSKDVPAPNDDGSGGLQEAPSDTSGSAIVALLLAASGTASQGGQSEQLEFALLTEGSYAFLAVKVADGTVVIGVDESGNAVVHSKDGTYNCKTSGAGYVCTSEQGESVDVRDDGSTASNDDGTSPPSDGEDGQGM